MSAPRAFGRVASPTLHATVLFSIAVFAAILAMAYVFKVEIVAKGVGKVVPLGRVQVVQPEFGGQIAAIHVRNGSRVAPGQVLIELDPTNAQAEVNTLRAERARLLSERDRIETVVALLPEALAMTRATIAATVADFVGRAPRDTADYHREQARLLSAELTELADRLARIDARIAANRKSEAVTRAAIARVESAMETQRERLEVTRTLLENRTTSRAVFLDVLDDFNRLEKDREIFQRELEQKATQETAYRNEKSSVVSGVRSRLLARKATLGARLFEIEERLVASQRELRNTRLLSPLEGIVDQLSVFTDGGIVEAGQELMRIVPVDRDFEVEAVFPNTDIGFLARGQRVNIKIDAFPSERFGSVSGEIADISADAIELPDASFGFVVRIRPETPYLASAGNRFPLQPGMTAVVDAITGERRIIGYFFAPIVKVVGDSLGER